jgi:hypothetical protein
MSVIATSTHTKSNVLKKEIWAGEGFAETVIVINDTAGTLLVGTVLGKVTATGKYKRAVQTAVAAAIVMNEQTILGATDTKAVALTRGFAKVSKAGLVLDATYDLQAEKDVIYASLEALGIQVLDTI